jgi:hypothetical protein
MSRQLTVLKMDCEGCEWRVLPLFAEAAPALFASIKLFLLELHFVYDPIKGPGSGVQTSAGARVYDLLRDYLCYSFATNSDASVHRRQIAPVDPQIVHAGAFDSACCAEIHLVKKGVT